MVKNSCSQTWLLVSILLGSPLKILIPRIQPPEVLIQGVDIGAQEAIYRESQPIKIYLF